MHITVCICTFKRPDLLRRLLDALSGQETANLFTFSAVVADNDANASARDLVSSFAASSGLQIVYCVEPIQNFALVRNRTLAHAQGEFAAFIDDDEFPVKDWLLQLFRACEKYSVVAVLGPVIPHFDREPPRWVQKGGFYHRPRHQTGFDMEWSGCRTGNVLFRRKILDDLEIPFREEFRTGGEDLDFFRRLAAKGHRFIWCDEAIAYEVVPLHRCKRSFLLSRAFLRGRDTLKHPEGRLQNIFKSLVAVPLYTLALPLLLIAGHHHFMRYLVRWGDHTGRLLAWVGLNPVRERPM